MPTVDFTGYLREEAELQRANYVNNRAFSDLFDDEIKTIVMNNLSIGRVKGLARIKNASLEDDMKRATDMKIYFSEDTNCCVAARMRKYKYLRYWGEFTIRSSVPANVPTEIHKILDGWGDIMFYGFADPEHKKILCWIMLDLHALRSIENWETYCEERMNNDGTELAIFDTTLLNHMAGGKLVIAKLSPPSESSPAAASAPTKQFSIQESLAFDRIDNQ